MINKEEITKFAIQDLEEKSNDYSENECYIKDLEMEYNGIVYYISGKVETYIGDVVSEDGLRDVTKRTTLDKLGYRNDEDEWVEI